MPDFQRLTKLIVKHALVSASHKFCKFVRRSSKSDQASWFFVLKKLTPLHPGPPGTGGSLLFLSTGAEAPAYYQSASPRRRRFYSPAIHPCPVYQSCPY